MNSLSFLIIEDSPTMRQLLSFTLKRIKGSKVAEASNGVEGIKKLKEGSYDLLVVDINMPLMDGLKLLSIVRSDPTLCNVPIIIVTTEGADTDRDRAMKLGATAYISKPIQTTAFMNKVKEILKIDS